VVFPAPLGPSSASTEPRGTVRSTPCSTSIRPYAACTPISCSAGCVAASVAGVVGSGAVSSCIGASGPQVRRTHALVGADLVGRSDGDDPAEVQHVDARAHVHHQLDVMFDEEHGETFP